MLISDQQIEQRTVKSHLHCSTPSCDVARVDASFSSLRHKHTLYCMTVINANICLHDNSSDAGSQLYVSLNCAVTLFIIHTDTVPSETAHIVLLYTDQIKHVIS